MSDFRGATGYSIGKHQGCEHDKYSTSSENHSRWKVALHSQIWFLKTRENAIIDLPLPGWGVAYIPASMVWFFMDQRSGDFQDVFCEDMHRQATGESSLILMLCWIKRLAVCLNKVCFRTQLSFPAVLELERTASVLSSSTDIRNSVETSRLDYWLITKPAIWNIPSDYWPLFVCHSLQDTPGDLSDSYTILLEMIQKMWAFCFFYI